MRTSTRRTISTLLLCSGLATGCGGTAPPPVPPDVRGENDPAPVQVGQPAPPLEESLLSGAGLLSLASLRGKVVILVFWATWSEPDKRLLLALSSIHRRYDAKDIEIVAVSMDDGVDSPKDFRIVHRIPFHVLWSPNRDWSKRWSVSLDPSTFIVDRKGIVRFIHGGFHDGEETEIEKEAASLR